MPAEEKPSVLSKFLAINSKPTKDTFPELPDVVIWFRFTLATLYGLFLGLSPTYRSGGSNVIFGFNFIVFVPVLYCSTFLGANQESYDNKILFSGVMSSVAWLLLIWTYLYTLDHEGEAETLASILSSSVGAEANVATERGETIADSIPPIGEDSEF
eukprot:CAMPEP_0176078184 /NCGR_PEP_ID=MMETSP0120_2-20121206/39098_1 /TAXON_ID=160619 /ORGANISM="Kryptoperidinium foliaceum, Strain CCMP 1326" /LENGTH=156 /DNA_ID=CAMNT_0017411929 /DNA_START=78 /DNA_END=548 /DNA_ORIENTATION=+